MGCLVGHSNVTRVIKTLDDLGSSSLFVGQEGVGKATFVNELISGVHKTNVLYLIDPMVDDVRKAVSWSHKRSFNSIRVLVVEFSKMNQSAQNALLKLLEEPPDRFKIILLGPDSVFLPTIKSRCLTYRFNSLSKQELTAILSHLGYENSAAVIAAEFGEGSVVKALNYLDAEEAVSSSRFLLGSRPSECVASVIKMKQDFQLSIFTELFMMTKNSMSSFVLLSKSAGIRARILLSLMLSKR